MHTEVSDVLVIGAGQRVGEGPAVPCAFSKPAMASAASSSASASGVCLSRPGDVRAGPAGQGARPVSHSLWTTDLVLAPLLVAWSARPSAARLAELLDPEILERALRTVRDVFGERPAPRLRAWYLHNWQDDPLAGRRRL
ncbi:MAG: hypothetical protein LC797_19095 [Chloroflexi bacterium]|nr:hypothetical protein [Chloroflexota bacterium]